MCVCPSGVSVGCMNSAGACVRYLHVSSIYVCRGGVHSGCVYEMCMCTCRVCASSLGVYGVCAFCRGSQDQKVILRTEMKEA